MTFRKQPRDLKTAQVTALQLRGEGKAAHIPDLWLVICESRVLLSDDHRGAHSAKTVTPWKL